MAGRGWMERGLSGVLAVLLLCPALLAAEPTQQPTGNPTPDYRDWSGQRIMEEVFRRHEQYPYVFERQSMVLTDAEGRREVRRLRRFSRVEEDRSFKYLLLFDHPPEVRGTALLAVRHPSGESDNAIYLPAFGPVLKSSATEHRGNHFLGTDFAVEDLAAEVLSEYRYRRRGDKLRGDTLFFVVDAKPADAGVERITGYGLRRHFVRQDNFYITRTDYFDRRMRPFKSQSSHDLRQVDGEMWRANMVLMENRRERHQSLIKIDQRVFSKEYVPAELFTAEYLLENRHLEGDGAPVEENKPDPEERQ